MLPASFCMAASILCCLLSLCFCFFLGGAGGPRGWAKAKGVCTCQRPLAVGPSDTSRDALLGGSFNHSTTVGWRTLNVSLFFALCFLSLSLPLCLSLSLCFSSCVFLLLSHSRYRPVSLPISDSQSFCSYTSIFLFP